MVIASLKAKVLAIVAGVQTRREKQAGHNMVEDMVHYLHLALTIIGNASRQIRFPTIF